MGIIRVQLKIYRDEYSLKILADNMFQNYFMISYRRHEFFVPFIYIFLPDNDVSIVLKEPFQCIFGPSLPFKKRGKQSPFP